MFSQLRYLLQGTAVLLAVSLNTIFCTVLVFILALLKFISPKGPARNAINRCLSFTGEYWVSFNKFLAWFLVETKWDIDLPEGIDHKGSYLVFSNHQSWVDILVMQHVLNRRAPFMRFLLKRELIWVPFLGFCWWALDMAFLRRYSRQELLRNPALRGKDLENAARACEKLKHIPVSMVTYPEGTRFTREKHRQQKSPYQHLLRPRYGGVGQVLYSFDDALDCLIDITIVYPDGIPGLWQYVSGQVKKISVMVRLCPIEEAIRGKNFRADSVAKKALKTWLDNIWLEKDQLISRTLGAAEDANFGF